MTKYLVAIPSLVFMLMIYSANTLETTFFKSNMHDDQYVSTDTVQREERMLDSRQQRHFETITEKYRVSETIVKDVIHYAYKYEKKSFPKAEDILAVVGIESSWNPFAKSKLKTDPALGLTQIRPGQWKQLIESPTELLEIEKQIKYAAEILHVNFKLTKSAEDAVIAYNVGYGSWSGGLYNTRYLNKFRNERSKFGRSV